AYVYFTYGMHHCLNVVTREVGVAEAVLIRAVAPTDGLERMREHRAVGESVRPHLLARARGNLCRAFGIDRGPTGASRTDAPLTLRALPRTARRSCASRCT